MPARIQNSNFSKVSLWVVNILNKDSKTIFVLKKYHVLQKLEFENRVWLLNQIQTLADVWVRLRFEFLFENSWLS
jgi:hypothetical protein